MDFRPREMPPMMTVAAAGLRGVGQLLGGLIGVGGVVLGEVADGAAADQAAARMATYTPQLPIDEDRCRGAATMAESTAAV